MKIIRVFSKQLTKKRKTFTVPFKLSRVKDWHVYSKKLRGGIYKVCNLLDGPNTADRGIFVKKAFQDVGKSEKNDEHTST